MLTNDNNNKSMMSNTTLEPRYLKRPFIRSRLINFTKNIENNPQIKTLVKGMMLNHEEFLLLQDNSLYQSYYPTSTQKIPVSNVKPLRNKQSTQPNSQLIKPIAEILCESEEGFSVYPQNKVAQDLIISNNQLNLESAESKFSNKKSNPNLFRNLQVESIESSRDIINLTTSIDTCDLYRLKNESKRYENNDTNNRNKNQRYANNQQSIKKYPSTDAIKISKSKQNPSEHLIPLSSNQFNSQTTLKTTKLQSMCQKKREEALANKTFTKAKSKSKHKTKGNCILVVPISEMHQRQFNHIQLAKMCPCADHKKRHQQNQPQQPSSTNKAAANRSKKQLTQLKNSPPSSNPKPIFQQSSHLTEFMNQSQNILSHSRYNDYENTFLKKHSEIYHNLNKNTNPSK